MSTFRAKRHKRIHNDDDDDDSDDVDYEHRMHNSTGKP